MDFQTAFNLAVLLVGVLGSFGARQVMERIKEAKAAGTDAGAAATKRAEAAHELAVEAHEALHAHRLHIAEYYVSVKRFEGFEAALFKKLDSIEEKLDRKADKSQGAAG